MSTPSTLTTYSAFWPLQFLVVCLGIWILYHLYATYENYRTIESEIVQLTPRGGEAIGAKRQLLALVQEVQQLAEAGDAAAAQILSDLKIQPVSPELPAAQAKPK